MNRGKMKKIIDKKPCGKEEIFVINERVSVKIINVDKGKRLSLQKHSDRDEFLRIIGGKALITVGNKNKRYDNDGELYIRRGTLHRIKALSNSLKILEISFGKFDNNDITRIEDDYG